MEQGHRFEVAFAIALEHLHTFQPSHRHGGIEVTVPVPVAVDAVVGKFSDLVDNRFFKTSALFPEKHRQGMIDQGADDQIG